MTEILLCFTLVPLLVFGFSSPDFEVASSDFAVTDSPLQLNRSDYRLPRNVLPDRYVIELKLENDFYDTKKFAGNVSIFFLTTESISATTGIVLNMYRNIKIIRQPELYKVSNDFFLYGKFSSNGQLQRTTVLFSRILAKNTKYRLDISYNATMYNDIYGFYVSPYSENNQTEWIAATQFAPTYARTAFPCLDEPSFKATFDVVLKHPLEYFAISNSKVESSIIDAKTKSFIRTKFQRTPKMSTYLLAFVVSKFSTLSKYANAVRHQVVSQHDHILSTDAALSRSPRILSSLAAITGVRYTDFGLGKLDHVALPDFGCGAMENWGIVTYRESYLVLNAQESSAMDRKTAVETAAHELSHMWFGNLRTCEWWNATWLNEGFATYFQHYVVDQVESGWNMSNHLVLEKQSVQAVDSFISTLPLTTTENDTLQEASILNRFNSISYKKGASILYMMEKFMGTNRFLQGIKRYMSADYRGHFDNVKPEDLWNAWKPQELSDVLPTGVTLKDVMTTWTEARGYPVLNVTVSGNKIQMKAHRFFSYKQNQARNNSVWYIPVSYTTSNSPNFENTTVNKINWIKGSGVLEFYENLHNSSFWIVVNLQSSAYIRVNYDDKLWTALAEALQKNPYQFHVSNRAQVVDDAFNLAHAGLISYTRAFSIIQFLQDEFEYHPWYSAFKGFQFLKQRTANDTVLTRYINDRIKGMLEKIYMRVQSEPSTRPNDILKKTMVLTWACQLNYTDCVEDAKNQFLKFQQNNTLVDANLRSFVYCTGVQYFGRQGWAFLYQRLNKVKVPSEVPVILEALGCTYDEGLLKLYLQQSINATSLIRKQDAHTVFLSVINGSPQGVQIGLDFMMANFTKMIVRYRALNGIPTVVKSLAEKLTNETHIEKFQIFLTRYNLVVKSEALEHCYANLVWIRSRKPDLAQYFKDSSGIVTVNIGVFLLSFLLSTILT